MNMSISLFQKRLCITKIMNSKRKGDSRMCLKMWYMVVS